MPCISGNYQPAGSLFIDVFILGEDILPSGGEGAEDRRIDANVPKVRALIDTGANRTCLAREVAQAAGLSSIGKQDMISASETTAVNTYIFSLGIPIVHEVTPTGQQKGSLDIFPSIEGMEFNAVNASFGVLLGMDVLSQCSFKMDFDGHFSLCW